MLVKTAQTRSRVRAMLAQLRCPTYLIEDFEQEAVIHWWRMEAQNPGETPSWYCTACCFHVRHETVRGRSIDSLKRRHLGSLLTEPGDDLQEDGCELPAENGTPLEHCCARDILEQLSRRLDHRAFRIACLFAAGYSAREIATQVELSHTAVGKQRRRIRAVAEEIGINL